MFSRIIFIIFFTFLANLSPSIAGDAEDDKAAIAAFMESPVASKFHKSAYAYAVFPTIGKGGFGIGAAHGSGRVYAGGKKTGDVSMTQLSFGFQAGGQAYQDDALSPVLLLGDSFPRCSRPTSRTPPA